MASSAADPYVPGWAVRGAGDRLGVPTIAFYHSDVPRLLSQRFGAWTSPFARSYLRRLYAGFDLILAPSAIMQDHLAAMGIGNVALQPLGVDVGVFNPGRRNESLRKRLQLGPGTRLLVYAGRFAREKNIRSLAEMSVHLGRAYHLVLVGGRRFERLNDHITILPYQRDAVRLAGILASCDAFIHAGDQETYGLVVAEAMACGLPVVAVAQGALPELVDEAVGACARTPSPTLLASAVQSVFERDANALQIAARARVEQKYSWDRVFTQLVSRYAVLADRAPISQLAPIGA